MKVVERPYRLPFCLITTLFALWGFANDITNPMVAAFQTLMELSAAKAALIQFAFYGGYATMAVPAALFIRRYSYKRGILLGLALYAAGAFLVIPAVARQSFGFFCCSLYVLTFGLAFLETTANPFILSLGSRDSATRRLNLSQAFNPMGSLAGMAVASMVVLPNLLSDQRDATGQILFHLLPESEKAGIRVHDLAVIREPYVALGCVVLAMLLVFALVKVPASQPAGNRQNSFRDSMRNLRHNRLYCEGVIAQLFYVAAQIMVWTFIIQYAGSLGISKATAQNYNILAMCLFLAGRFLSTALMKFIDGRRLLIIFGIGAALCSLGTVLVVGKAGLGFLVCISFFMSLMFPTIYGTALQDVSPEDTSLGAAFLVMAIVGGALLPPVQGMVIDCGTILGHPAVNISYLLPLLCFAVVTIYGIRSKKNETLLSNPVSGRQ
ncbi:MAG: L-fucose:H+ symporter permease [Bacteroidales bacterium]|nr:L-fucose:H+ symporter permease [Bacteroidales bacterium]